MLSDGSDVSLKQGKQMKQLMLLLSLEVEEEELGVTQITYSKSQLGPFCSVTCVMHLEQLLSTDL